MRGVAAALPKPTDESTIARLYKRIPRVREARNDCETPCAGSPAHTAKIFATHLMYRTLTTSPSFVSPARAWRFIPIIRLFSHTAIYPLAGWMGGDANTHAG